MRDKPDRAGEHSTNPVSLAVKQTFGLEKHLLISLLFGNPLLEVGSVGMNLYCEVGCKWPVTSCRTGIHLGLTMMAA